MFLPRQNLLHINSITHEGKVLVFGTDSQGLIYYSIKQDGFEDSYGSTEVTGWENWQRLELPQEEPDQSVIEKEQEELTYQNESGNRIYLLRSLYQSHNLSDIAPVQLVSAIGHLYVFRQSRNNTLLVDRFVLDGLTNRLTRKLDVRFKRSRQKYKPLQTNSNGQGNQTANTDSLDFRDSNGNPFYEPTTEISLVNNLQEGWFSVVLLPTGEHDKYRWHIFAYNSQTQKVELISIKASEVGLFDVKDETVLEQQPGDIPVLIPRSIPGIIRRTIDLGSIKVANGLTATKYDTQVERQTEAGLQLLKEATRVMLAIPTDRGDVAAFSFAAGKDGTLAQIDETVQTIVRRSNDRQVLLPLNTLDEIKAIGESIPPAEGTIIGMERAEEDRVRITSPEVETLKAGDLVRISGTMNYNGQYPINRIDDNTFEIAAQWQESELGNWEVIPQSDSGLVFDGIITAVEHTTDGKLRVASRNHGLGTGDTVQIVDTRTYNGTYPVIDLSKNQFTINVQWQPGEALNLKAISRRRRGITFDGDRDYIAIGSLNLTTPNANRAFGKTYSAWLFQQIGANDNQLIIGQQDGLVQLLIQNGQAVFRVRFAEQFEQITDPLPVAEKEWLHYAGVFSYNQQTQATTMKLCRNGQEVASAVFEKMATPHLLALQTFEAQNPTIPRPVFRWLPEFRVGGSEAGTFFTGQISDVQIWDRPRTTQEIQNTMYLQLSGREVGLAGYWRLGAIAEDRQRRVIDFSVNGRDGIVHGDAFVSAITLDRTLRDGTTPTIRYINEELFAVSQRATYVESFEFRGAEPGNFEIVYWGKPNRSTDERIEFQGETTEFQALDNGWFLASCRFTVPDDISLVRSFGIANVQGNWQQLEIRKHRIRLVSDSITEARYTDAVALETLANNQASLTSSLRELSALERQEAALLAEKGQLEARLLILNNPQLQQEVDRLRQVVDRLLKEEEFLHRSYITELNSPLNYYCRIVNRRSGLAIDVQNFSTEQGALLGQYQSGGRIPQSQHWRFEKVPGTNFYRIVNKHSRLAIDVQNFSTQTGALLGQYQAGGRIPESQHWQFEYHVQFPGFVRILNRHATQLAIDVQNASTTQGASVRLAAVGGTLDSQQWSLQSTNEVATTVTATAYQNLEAKRAERRQQEQSLRELERLLSEGISGKAALEQRLATVNNLLNALQQRLNTLNTTFIAEVNRTQQTPQTMPQIHQDARGLVTQGARLGFVRPVSRLNAIETSEGNVQLSYFDTEGRMRLTNFDVTSDSRNASFEQWIPDSLRTCPLFDKDASILRLNKPIPLTTEWTIEAWFYYPLPLKLTGSNVLTGSRSDRQIVVRGGTQLGTFINGTFYDSGYNLEQLSHGWHHLVVVGKGSNATATTLFYVDGVPVGDVKMKAVNDANREVEQLQQSNASTAQIEQARARVSQLQSAQLKSTTEIEAIGNTLAGDVGVGTQFGKLTEVRIWNIALTPEEIEVNRHTLLSGNEPGLVAYYPMNEAQGTEVRDASGNGWNGELQSAIWFGCTVPIGNPGHGVMSFDGINDHIILSNPNSLNFAGQITIEAWVKPEAINGLRNIVAHGYVMSPNGEVSLRISEGRYYIGSWDGQNYATSTPIPAEDVGNWVHLAGVYDGTAWKLYRNGAEVGSTNAAKGAVLVAGNWAIGASGMGNERFFKGCIADVRIWNRARSPQQIRANLYKRLTGSESNLVGYWALNQVNPEQANRTVPDLTRNQPGTVQEALVIVSNTLPIVQDALVSAEYSTVSLAPETQQRTALMRRFFASPGLNGVMLLPDKRIEPLELLWIGNAQFEPTLLGYIEGAPPVPSENLTVEENYNGATSVELTQSDDVVYSWSRERDSGFGKTFSAFAGFRNALFYQVGNFSFTALEGEVGYQGDRLVESNTLANSNISASSNSSATDRLELRGALERTAKFDHLGKRFIPKNVGYALVVSGLADVYITRLSRSRKMVSYQLLPNQDVPLDVNTITFLMNPAYVMNGSLDGQVGSSAADDRFYSHVTEMRSQMGSRYPASYYRLQEAYDLRQRIEQLDAERQAYFASFESTNLEGFGRLRELFGDSRGAINDRFVDSQTDDFVDDEIGVDSTTSDNEPTSQEVVQGQVDANAARRQQIAARLNSQESRLHALSSFQEWQRKFEDIQIQAAKRNIVNTYVWDADGGLRAESQQFANTIEHTIGGSLNFQQADGASFSIFAFGVGTDITAQDTLRITQTLSKTENRSRGFSLNVDLSGLESTGITDNQDFPLMPGEKVDRYRFMSCYLEGHTDHFHDFFNSVVDPEWLRSNDEEARALRQVMSGRPNRTWRVLHRVTYVERPALLGFGQNLR